MDQYVSHALTVFVGFFAIMNPIANTPIFLGLTTGEDGATKRKIALYALMLAFVIVVVFCIIGRFVFDMFGISLPAFRITGGILVFLVGFHMLQGELSRVHKPSEDDREQSREAELSVAVSPLAMPLLAGPGTIATAMNFASVGGLYYISSTIAAYFLLCLITYLFFVFGERIIGYIGQTAINAITRIMGLILAVIGTQMIVDGVRQVSKSLPS